MTTSAPLTRKAGRPPASKQPAQRKTPNKKRAQRMDRDGNGLSTVALKDHIAQLKAALEEISKSIASFSDEIVESQVLTPYPYLAARLQNTVQSCLHLAGNSEGSQDIFNIPQSSQNPSRILPSRETKPEHEDQKQKLATPQSTRELPCPAVHLDQSLLCRLDGSIVIDTAAFMEYLRIACLSYGYMILDNPSIPLDVLKRPFRLLFPLATRDTITTFFYTRLLARLTNQTPDESFDIPCFQIGGSGSHYSEVSIPSKHRIEAPRSGQSLITSALSGFSPQAQEELHGEWFDIQDLEGYLRAKDICISTKPLAGTGWAVKAVDFTAALIRTCICLGQSPGFRRSDVDIAIVSSSWN